MRRATTRASSSSTSPKRGRTVTPPHAGEDIDNWSILSLEEAVRDYQKTAPKQDPPTPQKLEHDGEDLSGDEAPKLPQPVSIAQQAEEDKPAESDPDDASLLPKTDATAPAFHDEHDQMTMNDQRQQITQKILLQSDEERTAMNVRGYYPRTSPTIRCPTKRPN